MACNNKGWEGQFWHTFAKLVPNEVCECGAKVMMANGSWAVTMTDLPKKETINTVATTGD